MDCTIKDGDVKELKFRAAASCVPEFKFLNIGDFCDLV